jgi:uncharacterized membrane protein (TIGR02234 family)
MNGRRSFALTLLALAAAAVLTLIVAGLTWISADYTLTGQTWTNRITLTGRDLAPLTIAGAWIALASAVGIIATARLWRRIVGVIVILAGASVAIGAVVGAVTASRVVVAEVSRAGGTVTTQTAAGIWPVLTVVAGMIITLCGLAATMQGPRWPAMSSRYERSPSARPADPWAALDRGEDPTA